MVEKWGWILKGALLCIWREWNKKPHCKSPIKMEQEESKIFWVVMEINPLFWNQRNGLNHNCNPCIFRLPKLCRTISFGRFSKGRMIFEQVAVFWGKWFHDRLSLTWILQFLQDMTMQNNERDFVKQHLTAHWNGKRNYFSYLQIWNYHCQVNCPGLLWDIHLLSSREFKNIGCKTIVTVVKHV